MSELQIKTIDAIKKLDNNKLEKVAKYIVFIEKNELYDIPNDETIESFIEGEELLNNPATKYYSSIEELKESLEVK